ncbi:MAG: hypothetical protein M1822_003488 [Bathelium mastoideum]|nr:MAG: hypothetical protein M1822_003488 [Bathelium mastoideum]
MDIDLSAIPFPQQEENVPEGYPRLAKRMGLLPKIAIFRRFGFLNQLNILYMQAELQYLEKKLKKVQIGDNASTGDEQNYVRDFDWLMHAPEGA